MKEQPPLILDVFADGRRIFAGTGSRFVRTAIPPYSLDRLRFLVDGRAVRTERARVGTRAGRNVDTVIANDGLVLFGHHIYGTARLSEAGVEIHVGRERPAC